MSAINRLMGKVIVRPVKRCWVYTGCKDQCGYGMIAVGSKKDGSARSLRTHRVSYEAHVGPIPDGMQLDHLCRVRSCVNPDHLEVVTQQENIRRGETGRNMREKTHCPAGHEYSGENLALNKAGSRKCRACHRETARRSKEKARQCR